jgi:hypothetical protein
LFAGDFRRFEKRVAFFSLEQNRFLDDKSQVVTRIAANKKCAPGSLENNLNLI